MTDDNVDQLAEKQVITMGCRLNGYESDVIQQNLHKAGAKDVIVVNSCAVTAEAVRQTRQMVRKLKRKNPEKKIIVTGCAAQIEPKTFADMDEVAKVLGNHDKLSAETYQGLFDTEDTEKVIVNDIMSVRETAGHMMSGFDSRTRAYLQIQNGCNHRCTFCIIPYGRGNSRSVPAGVIIEQIKKAVDHGVKEIVLTGVDITSWGEDLPSQPALSYLVRKILSLVPDLPRLRLSSIDSIEVDEMLLDMIATEKRFMPHLHLSLQSGDNMILKRMKRRHSREQALEFCHTLKEKRPEIVFGADIIAGFPTETDEMFQNTLAFITEAQIIYAHIFPFSAREGTPAARMPQLQKHVIKERASLLRKAGQDNYNRFVRTLVGQQQNVIAENNKYVRAENFLRINMSNSFKAGDVFPVLISDIKQGEVYASAL
ncbi:MAG: tRNA (N(6)-L-threonylcarbamoyladenosine(37)-C(2))-methylthiotransferase MtaB [Pseudomonadota bacterium]